MIESMNASLPYLPSEFFSVRLALCSMILVLGFVPITAQGQEGLLSWSNKAGKTIQAEFVSLESDLLTISKGGKLFKVSLDQLSSKSQDQAKQLARAETNESATHPKSAKSKSNSFDLFERKGWVAFASDGAECGIDLVAHPRGARTHGIHFQSRSGFDTGIRWENDFSTRIELPLDACLVFWLRAETKNNFQIDQPVVVVGFEGGKVTYRPEKNLLVRERWIGVTIPIEANSKDASDGWKREITGNPDLSTLSSIEIHHDVWDYGIEVFYDGLTFASASDVPVPAFEDERSSLGVRLGRDIEMAFQSNLPPGSTADAELSRERFSAAYPLPDLEFVKIPRNEAVRFNVQPYYLYPSDQKYFAAYEQSIEQAIIEVQKWYGRECGLSFRMEPLKVVQSNLTYQQMKWGNRAPIEGSSEMPNWLSGVLESVGGLKDETIVWVFAQGGGGWAGGNLYENFRGYAIFGDWVLEPISGVTNPDGVPASEATWQVQGGVPMGTTVHELGHAFGLHHPDNFAGKSIMRWHGDYPDTGLLPHEKLILRQCPFFTRKPPPALAPFPKFSIKDSVVWGETVEVPGYFFNKSTKAELVTSDGVKQLAPFDVAFSKLKITIPADTGPGYIRLRNGDFVSHGVPVNVYPPEKSE